MERGGLVAQAVERLLNIRLERSERGDRPPFAVVGVVGCEVDLGAIARGEAHRFSKLGRKCVRLLAVERDALAQLDRRVVMRGADEDDAHQLKCTAGKARRTRMTSANPASATYAERRPAEPRTR